MKVSRFYSNLQLPYKIESKKNFIFLVLFSPKKQLYILVLPNKNYGPPISHYILEMLFQPPNSIQIHKISKRKQRKIVIHNTSSNNFSQADALDIIIISFPTVTPVTLTWTVKRCSHNLGLASRSHTTE